MSATRGGLGKTTLSLGIIAAWMRQGRRVSVFKKGPDFIDAGWLGAAARRSCYNLDLFLMDHASIIGSFQQHGAESDVALIEGNRGLYDGVDEAGTYSTARLSRLLASPVVLILDCTKSSGTVGAVALGCRTYDPGVEIGGVILNNVSSPRHEAVARKAVEQGSGIRVIGAIPRQKKGTFPERHMGLTPFQEHPGVEQAIASAAELAERYLDIDALWSLAVSAKDLPLSSPDNASSSAWTHGGEVAIGIIRDQAFQFYYPDNLEALERNGARIIEINALHDTALPDIDAMYIGGGFPETHAATLSRNRTLCHDIKRAADAGMPIYGECGGLIYLGRSIRVRDETFGMTGVLPVDFILEQRPQAHGYAEFEVEHPDTFLAKGIVVRGHEFHYSRVASAEPLPPMAYRMKRGSGIADACDGLMYRNVLACYTHLHALGAPDWASALVRKAREYRGQRKQDHP